MAISTTHRVIHLGTLTRTGGAEELIELGKLLRGDVRVELVGRADKTMRPMMLRAHDEGSVVWHGEVSDQRLRELIEDALAVLSPPFRYPRGVAATILALRRATPAEPANTA